MTSTFNIKKLDGRNYDSWSLKMKSVLVYQKLLSKVLFLNLKIRMYIVILEDQEAKAVVIILSIPPVRISCI